MENNLDTYMPGFTHLQKAQPVTLAHHIGAYMEMFKRDFGRLFDIYDRMNYCPLGAGALGGKLLGAGGGGCLLFYVPKENQDRVRAVLSDMHEVKFRFENEGTKIICRD